MNLQEYNKVKEFTYRQYCKYLQNKYGKAVCAYMTPAFNKRKKVTRTNEGLYCHHIYEDHAIMLSNKNWAQKNPYEWQLPENLCYCDLLEHLLLHILICEYPSSDKNLLEAVGIGGVLNFIVPELNDVYSGYESGLAWQRKCHSIIKENKDVYLELIKRVKKLEGYSGYVEEGIYRSMGAIYGTWSNRQNKKLYEELKKIK